jgi:outer membrane protein assembly factor BamB
MLPLPTDENRRLRFHVTHHRLYCFSMTIRISRLELFALLLSLLLFRSAPAGDWPMWRFDAGHTAASPDNLPQDLVLRWTRQYSQRTPTWDDPLNNDLMSYDRVFEPIVADGRVFVGFNDSDKLVCWDLATGEELWHFFTEGPVRLPPVYWNGNVYCVSDDGYLYCLKAIDGSLLWKFRGGPSAR